MAFQGTTEHPEKLAHRVLMGLSDKRGMLEILEILGHLDLQVSQVPLDLLEKGGLLGQREKKEDKEKRVLRDNQVQRGSLGRLDPQVPKGRLAERVLKVFLAFLDQWVTKVWSAHQVKLALPAPWALLVYPA